MPSEIARITDIVKQVNRIIKDGTGDRPPVISLNDIIPHRQISLTDRLHFTPTGCHRNIAKYGEEQTLRYEQHEQKLERVRTEAIKCEDLYAAKGISSLSTTVSVATTLCGFGECQETSNRALTELIIKFSATKIQVPITVVTTEGRCLLPNNEVFGYHHVFLIIGEIPKVFKLNGGLELFNQFSDDCILFDSSLGLVEKAKNLPRILRENFSQYQINKIVGVMTIDISNNAECFIPSC